MFGISEKALLPRRRLPYRHHHQPDSIEHKQQNCQNEIFADSYMLKHAPHHAGDDGQVDQDEGREYLRAGHVCTCRAKKVIGFPPFAKNAQGVGISEKTKIP